MRPRERRETGEQDLFRSRLDQIIDMNHPLAKLARTVDWAFLERRFGEIPHDQEFDFKLHYGDLTGTSSLIRIVQKVQPDEIDNLAAQSHVGVSTGSA